MRVLAQVRATEWPSRLLDIETLAGRLVGDEFHARVNAPGPGTGLTPSGWQRALAEKAMDAMGADLADEGKDWPRLWAFNLAVLTTITASMYFTFAESSWLHAWLAADFAALLTLSLRLFKLRPDNRLLPYVGMLAFLGSLVVVLSMFAGWAFGSGTAALFRR